MSPTAKSPTTRYLTPLAFKMDKSSLNSSSILWGFFLQSVGGQRHLGDGAQAHMRGQGLPFAQLGGLHFLETCIDGDGLVHRFVCSTGGQYWQRRFSAGRNAGPSAPAASAMAGAASGRDNKHLGLMRHGESRAQREGSCE